MPKSWLPPKVWFHGSQSTSTGGSSARNGEACADHRLVRAQHALGVDHALRLAGRARGEQEFGDGVGSDFGVRRVDRGGRLRREQRRRTASPAVAGGSARDHDLGVVRHGRGDGAREGGAVGGEDEARRQNVEDGFAACRSPARPANRRAEIGAYGTPASMAAEAEQRMLDVVAGEDGDRALGATGRVAAAPRRARAPRERLRIAHACASRRRASRCARNVRSGAALRPMRQAFGERARIGRQRLRRAHQDARRRLALDERRPRGAEPHRRGSARWPLVSASRLLAAADAR